MQVGAGFKPAPTGYIKRPEGKVVGWLGWGRAARALRMGRQRLPLHFMDVGPPQ